MLRGSGGSVAGDVIGELFFGGCAQGRFDQAVDGVVAVVGGAGRFDFRCPVGGLVIAVADVVYYRAGGCFGDKGGYAAVGVVGVGGICAVGIGEFGPSVECVIGKAVCLAVAGQLGEVVFGIVGVGGYSAIRGGHFGAVAVGIQDIADCPAAVVGYAGDSVVGVPGKGITDVGIAGGDQIACRVVGEGVAGAVLVDSGQETVCGVVGVGGGFAVTVGSAGESAAAVVAVAGDVASGVGLFYQFAVQIVFIAGDVVAWRRLQIPVCRHCRHCRNCRSCCRCRPWW